MKKIRFTEEQIVYALRYAALRKYALRLLRENLNRRATKHLTRPRRPAFLTARESRSPSGHPQL